MKSPIQLVIVLLSFTASCSCATLPTGAAGADADALARKIEAFVDKAAWEKTGAVRFTFAGQQTLTWDKARGFVIVKSGDLVTSLDLWDHGGFAVKKGVELDGAARDKALADAWSTFCNDTFWLNPLVKLFDDGVTRELVEVEGLRALKVTYGSGGVTPGDTYLWSVTDDGHPSAVRMWVSALPFKGMAFTWEGWITLATGAKVAASHSAAGLSAVAISDVSGADSAASLGVEGDFARLVERRAHH